MSKQISQEKAGEVLADKFVKGLVGGLAAGIAKNIPDSIVHNIFKGSTLSFWDYSAVLTLGYHPRSIGEQLFSVAFELVFSVIVGLIYMEIVQLYQTRYKIVRGATYGAMVWFVVRAAVQAFHIRLLFHQNLWSSIINASLSILYGIVLEWMVNRMDRHMAKIA